MLLRSVMERYHRRSMPSSGENLAARLLDAALERGWESRPALHEGSRSWTFAQLRDQTARLSTVLRMLRIGRGERVAVLMHDCLEAAAAVLGIIHAGAVAVPISELARPLDVRDVMQHAGAVAVIVDADLEPGLDEVRAQLGELREVLCVGGHGPGERDLHSMLRSAAPGTAAPVEPSDVAMIFYPQLGLEEDLLGVPHVHATPLLAFEALGQRVIGLAATDRVLSLVRLSTSYGLGMGLFFPLAAGAESVLLPEQAHSEAVFTALAAADPTVLLATPSVYGQLARDAESAGAQRPLARLRLCISGAEGMPPQLIPKVREVLGAEVVVGYGLTEAFQLVLAGTAADGARGACGRPIPGFEARIIDDEGVPVAADVIGTLQLRGPTVLTRYWAGREADAFTDGWFTTRDRFMTDDSGTFHHCGRVDDRFKVGGKWLSPAEVERALLAHEAVWECAVIGAEDEDGLTKPLAIVVANIGHDGGPMLEAELREYVKDSLTPYKYPRWIEFVDSLPKGPTGKVLRYKLRPSGRLRRAETGTDGSW